MNQYFAGMTTASGSCGVSFQKQAMPCPALTLTLSGSKGLTGIRPTPLSAEERELGRKPGEVGSAVPQAVPPSASSLRRQF